MYNGITQSPANAKKTKQNNKEKKIKTEIAVYHFVTKQKKKTTKYNPKQ